MSEVVYPSEEVEKRRRRLEKQLFDLLLLLWADSITVVVAKARARRILEDELSSFVAELNEFYQGSGIRAAVTPQEFKSILESVFQDFEDIVEGGERAQEYWNTEKGRAQRLDLLTMALLYELAAAVTVATARRAGVPRLYWLTMRDPQVCELCRTNEGYYSLNDPLPVMPAHPQCRCVWVLVFTRGDSTVEDMTARIRKRLQNDSESEFYRLTDAAFYKLLADKKRVWDKANRRAARG